MSARILPWIMQNLNALQVIRVSFSYHRDIRLTPRRLLTGTSFRNEHITRRLSKHPPGGQAELHPAALWCYDSNGPRGVLCRRLKGHMAWSVSRSSSSIFDLASCARKRVRSSAYPISLSESY